MFKKLPLLLILLPIFVTSGCVERKIIVNTEPGGADVYIDGEFAGKTPMEMPFTFYGTRRIFIYRKDYKSVVLDKEVNAPLYQSIPLDFVFEHLVPGKLTDKHPVDIKLEAREKMIPDLEADEDPRISELLERAKKAGMETSPGNDKKDKPDEALPEKK